VGDESREKAAESRSILAKLLPKPSELKTTIAAPGADAL